MIRPYLYLLAIPIWLASIVSADAQSFSELDLKPEQFKKLTLSPSQESTPSLKHRLFPDMTQTYQRNAAIYYHRAVFSFQTTEARLRKQQQDSASPGGLDDQWIHAPLTPELIQQAQQWLGSHQSAIQELDFARESSHCDWQLIPEERRADWFLLTLSEIQYCRSLSRLLAVKARLEIATGKFDDAVLTLRTGYKLASDVNESRLLIGSLVGIACIGIMNNPLLELISQENSPSMAWPLANLPASMNDIRPAIEREISILRTGGGFSLLENPERSRSTQEWRIALNDYSDRMTTLSAMTGDSGIMPFLMVSSYPVAKQMLLESGMPKEEIESMNSIQVVAIAQKRSVSITLDEYLKGLALEFREAIDYFAPLEKHLEMQAFEGKVVSELSLIPYVSVLLPAFQQVYQAGTRSSRQTAAIQVIEAIRLHMGQTGSFPKSLDEITIVPVPSNPETNKPFRYTFNNGQARLFDFGTYRHTSTVYELTPAEK